MSNSIDTKLLPAAKINSEIVRYFRINNLTTKSGKDKPNATAYTVAFSYNQWNGRVRYGACKFSKTENNEVFSKKAHRDTALARYTKYPVYYEVFFEDGTPSQMLHEVRESIKKMIFTLGMRCRHPKDLAMKVKPFEWTLKTRLNNGKILKQKVILIPKNAELTTFSTAS